MEVVCRESLGLAPKRSLSVVGPVRSRVAGRGISVWPYLEPCGSEGTGVPFSRASCPHDTYSNAVSREARGRVSCFRMSWALEFDGSGFES